MFIARQAFSGTLLFFLSSAFFHAFRWLDFGQRPPPFFSFVFFFMLDLYYRARKRSRMTGEKKGTSRYCLYNMAG